MWVCRVFSAHTPLIDTPLTHQESLSEVEEKYKKAMVSNAQLDNDKANLIYQVDTQKDVIEEMEEQMAEMKRELDEKSKVRFVLCGSLEIVQFNLSSSLKWRFSTRVSHHRQWES